MPDSTARLLLPFPIGTDPPEGPEQIEALAEALDRAAVWSQGAAVPLEGDVPDGHFHGETDTGLVWVKLGAAMVPLARADDARLTNARVPTDGSVTNAKVAAGAAIAESKLSLASDAAAGTASRRTLGGGAQQAAQGNHVHDDRYFTEAESDGRFARVARPVIRAWRFLNRAENYTGGWGPYGDGAGYYKDATGRVYFWGTARKNTDVGDDLYLGQLDADCEPLFDSQDLWFPVVLVGTGGGLTELRVTANGEMWLAGGANTTIGNAVTLEGISFMSEAGTANPPA